jgi:LuxR family maltose regulon positive regulatory protein
MKARVQIAAGDLSPAAGWARGRGIGVDDDPGYLHEYEYLTLARLLLAGPDHDPAAVLALLDRMHAAATRAGRAGSVLEIRTLQALGHYAHGDLAQALAVLERSFAETLEPESHVRLYLDEGAPMLALLRHAAGGAGVLRARARKLLGRAAEEPRQSLADPLSQRELQVLRLLESELTGPEIARRLYVSLNTLRTHTKRIFTKLDVTTRAAAVRRAHERGLL